MDGQPAFVSEGELKTGDLTVDDNATAPKVKHPDGLALQKMTEKLRLSRWCVSACRSTGVRPSKAIQQKDLVIHKAIRSSLNHYDITLSTACTATILPFASTREGIHDIFSYFQRSRFFIAVRDCHHAPHIAYSSAILLLSTSLTTGVRAIPK